MRSEGEGAAGVVPPGDRTPGRAGCLCRLQVLCAGFLGAHLAGSSGRGASRPAYAAAGSVRAPAPLRSLSLMGSTVARTPRRRLRATSSATRSRYRRTVAASALVPALPSDKVRRPGRWLGSLEGCDQAVTLRSRGCSGGMPCITACSSRLRRASASFRVSRPLSSSSRLSRRRDPFCSTLFVQPYFAFRLCVWGSVPPRTLAPRRLKRRIFCPIQHQKSAEGRRLSSSFISLICMLPHPRLGNTSRAPELPVLPPTADIFGAVLSPCSRMQPGFWSSCPSVHPAWEVKSRVSVLTSVSLPSVKTERQTMKYLLVSLRMACIC